MGFRIVALVSISQTHPHVPPKDRPTSQNIESNKRELGMFRALSHH